MELLPGKDVLVGAIDVVTNRIETAEEVAAALRAAMDHVPPGRNCCVKSWLNRGLCLRASIPRWP